MAARELTLEEKFKRFLYINSFESTFITGETKLTKTHSSDLKAVYKWAESVPKEMLDILNAANEDDLIMRQNIFFAISLALQDDTLHEDFKKTLRSIVLKIAKTDEEFFDFIKMNTTMRNTAEPNIQKISNRLKKMILEFYYQKDPSTFAHSVVHNTSWHGWTHKDIIKLIHYKCKDLRVIPIVQFVLFGIKKLPEAPEPEIKELVDLLKKSHELRTTEDPARAAVLIKELHVSVHQVNSKLNKEELVWEALVDDFTTREILKIMYKLFKMGFLKSTSSVLPKITKALTNQENIKSCNLHPLEVSMYLRTFEKGGKPMDPKLLEHLKTKEIRDETLLKISPIEPKCLPIIHNINKCFKLAHNNVKPTGKKFLVTVDVNENIDTMCMHNKRITCLEAVYCVIRFLLTTEKVVTLAVFKDSQIAFLELGKSYSIPKAVERIKEHKASYSLRSAPLQWATRKKKPFDVFLNFMSKDFSRSIPKEVCDKMESCSTALNNYSIATNLPDAKLIEVHLSEYFKADEVFSNMITICGFTPEFPRVMEAFCRGNFC